MKKSKRLLAVLLVLVMTLALCTSSVSAAGKSKGKDKGRQWNQEESTDSKTGQEETVTEESSAPAEAEAENAEDAVEEPAAPAEAEEPEEAAEEPAAEEAAEPETAAEEPAAAEAEEDTAVSAAGEDAEAEAEKTAEAEAEVQETQEGPVTICGEGETCSIEVTYDTNANIPGETEVIVEETDYSDPASADRNVTLADTLFNKYGNVVILDVRYLDISLAADNGEIEPEDDVETKIVLDEALSTDPGDADSGYPVITVVVHHTENGDEILDVSTIEDTEGNVTELSFVTDSFSEYELVTIQQYDSDGAISLMAVGDTKGENDLKPLSTGKTLSYNDDGTYTLSLSVTGDSQSETSTETKSANVMIILDVSNSMTANRAQSDTGSMGADTSGSGGGGGASEATYFQLYKSQSTSDPLSEGEVYSGTLYRYNRGWSVYSGKRYSTAYRSDAAEKALYDMVTDIADGEIEFSFITFNSSATEQTNGWTKDASQITGKLSSTGTSGSAKLSYDRGTAWNSALSTALTRLGTADDDPTYVIFITDGRPSDTYSTSYTNARRINTYNTADHTYNSSDSNTTLYGIYAYGLQEDYLDDVIYYAKNGSARSNVSDDTDTTGITDQYFRAGSTQDLQDAIETIKSSITDSIDYGGVDYVDGVATDTTNTTLSAGVDGAVSGLTYTVSSGGTTVYTATTASDGTVTFNIGGTTYDSASAQATYNGVTGTYYYAVDNDGNPLTFTVGSGDSAQTYQYKMALASYENSSIDWDLTAIGGLIGGYTYTLSFTVWPVQEAYDAAADLNNGVTTTYKWDTSLDTYEDLTDTKGYEKGGIEGYPNIVKYPNGTYAVLTNTSQAVEYYVVETQTDESGTVIGTTYEGPYTATPTSPSPMDLVGSSIPIEKLWLVSLSPSELQDWVDKGNTLTLTVKKGGTAYKDFRFPGGEDSGMTTTTDEDGNVTWGYSCAIAPGIMLSEAKAVAEGIDITKYTAVTMNSKTYYLLGDGHDYTIEEAAGSDLHFEFSTQTYHPMLVDGTLMNVEIDGSTAEIVDANLTELLAKNTLKGGISIYKEVYEADMTTQIEDCEDEFAFEVTMWSEDASGNKSPVYTTEDQFDGGSPISGSFGYRVYQDNDDGTTTTVQRDAIYSGTSPAVVTVGDEVTTMVVTMQANQYCYIVNVPAGTKYTVKEIQSDGYSLFYDSVSVLEGDSDTGLYEVVTENKLADGATALADGEETVAGYVTGNSSSKAIYKNWAGSFYVYHSSDKTIEKISFADERVSGEYDAENGYSYKFNIVDETKGNMLYGGYYSAYSKAGMTNTEIIKAAYTADSDGRYWYTDSAGTAYDAKTANIWKKAEAFTATVDKTKGGGTGTAMTPKANIVYYLKEVPNGYIRPYIHYTYDDVADGKPLKKLYVITASDDKNYDYVGYILSPPQDEGTPAGTGSLMITIKNPDGSFNDKLTAKSVFNGKSYPGGAVTVTRGYLYMADLSSQIGSGFTYQPCWNTLDEVLVSGLTIRTVNSGTSGDLTGDNAIGVEDVTPGAAEQD